MRLCECWSTNEEEDKDLVCKQATTTRRRLERMKAVSACRQQESEEGSVRVRRITKQEEERCESAPVCATKQMTTTGLLSASRAFEEMTEERQQSGDRPVNKRRTINKKNELSKRAVSAHRQQ